ncbi:hypothetical protein [Mucilaginibacter psychrotolerans]|uniref:YcxB family protein n=1 Tax=Mucilaginibacter psychrotolerans TaxID=1524096 RepID=A0A4Y8SNI5_9SPHI|nr:hypothetical protein [Mucilaginibacter psychrotolerans]TFF40245.1 hypothetical protein E2R66_03060 [Mucilaginibacter psychrotolerans]
MQTQVFKVDESQINRIARRNFLRILKIAVPIMVLVVARQYFQYKNELNIGIIIYMFIVPFVVLMSMYIGGKKATKSMLTLEIIQTDSGVEKRAEMAPYRQIAWQDLIVREKPNGRLDLYDKNVSAFMRWWNGKGRIVLPPEMLNRDLLLSELQKYAGRYNGGLWLLKV